MAYRFYHTDPPIESQIELGGDQAHHAANVMRFGLGDQIVLFNGRGTEHTATIQSLTKKRLIAQVIETRIVEPAVKRDITVAVALPKGDRQKFLIEKLVELGVRQLIPLRTQRAVADVNPKVIARIEKQIIEASKQCERSHLMTVASPQTVAQIATADAPSNLRLLAHPYDSRPLSQLDVDRDRAALIAVGPEGGFDDQEVATFVEAGWQATILAPTILRIETAAIAAAVALGVAK
jgi:16S rRNA (uracil1498-N3)-methyltransferase